MPKFYPEGSELPEGYVGKNYSSEIEITNNILFKDNIGVTISPPGVGLKRMPKVNALKVGGREREEEDYHHIIIMGRTKLKLDILIHINGCSMGATTPGGEIDKNIK
ncbi:hypothetical protein OMR58_25590 [Erwinia sp. INIA-01]|uniref:hypothetical protein n=1 Tax=Erwinia sp. INIA01 TaxID=2991500 RepID=UPI002224D130|nr:hypothetical protein [Erwinia sp. INIA01]MCW1877815.1 hypothetical protein [Erwinia sp. INIA01]